MAKSLIGKADVGTHPGRLGEILPRRAQGHQRHDICHEFAARDRHVYVKKYVPRYNQPVAGVRLDDVALDIVEIHSGSHFEAPSTLSR